MGRGQQLLVMTMTANQLQTDGQAVTALGKRQVDRGQAQQSPAAAEQRITGACQSGWRFTGGALSERFGLASVFWLALLSSLLATACAWRVMHQAQPSSQAVL